METASKTKFSDRFKADNPYINTDIKMLQHKPLNERLLSADSAEIIVRYTDKLNTEAHFETIRLSGFNKMMSDAYKDDDLIKKVDKRVKEITQEGLKLERENFYYGEYSGKATLAKMIYIHPKNIINIEVIYSVQGETPNIVEVNPNDNFQSVDTCEIKPGMQGSYYTNLVNDLAANAVEPIVKDARPTVIIGEIDSEGEKAFKVTLRIDRLQSTQYIPKASFYIKENAIEWAMRYAKEHDYSYENKIKNS